MNITAEEIKAMLDVALLTPTTTPTEVESMALIVRNEGYGQMCVNTAHIRRAAAALKGSGVKIVAPVGFPLGAVKTEIKVFEAEQALADGAAEIDMVLNIGMFLDGDFKYAEGDVRAVVKAAGGAPVKVIIETPFLTDRQKADASRLVQAAGALGGEAMGKSQGMDAGAKQGFIGINIADAADEGLVEQQGLDTDFVALERAHEIFARDFKRFGAKPGDADGESLAEFQTSELAAIVEQQRTFIEGEDGVGMLAGLAAQQQPAGHAKMKHDVTGAAEG